jgi:RNA polymerase sigma-70 factor, ECF subfamily
MWRKSRRMVITEATRPSAATVSEADVEAFHTVRPRLFGIAYRIVGSAAEADDVVQDAWIRWQETDRDAVRDAPAFLATATTRLAINVIQSARARRESHVGASVPNAIDAGADPALRVERREALEQGALVLLEKLSPVERAAYVLREAFDYPHRQIARLLGLTDANARQLVTRARMNLSSDRRRRVGAEDHERLVKVLVYAADTGDLAQLEQFLVAAAGRALEVAA